MSLTTFLAKINRRSCPLVPRISPLFKVALFALITITSIAFVTSVFAAKNVLKDKQDAIKEGGNQEAWLNESLASNAVSALQVITGEIPDKVLEGDITGYVPAGLLGTSTQMIASLNTSPASGILYLADTWTNFLGVKPAYAQNGQGFTGLQGILPLWRGFRNITYILSSVIFVIIGIMIMLRVKISPQAVITIQNAIPQLITTLILITFSYAIAGLLIDLMQFLQSFVVALLFNSAGKGLTSSILPQLIPPKLGYSFNDLSTGGMNTIADLTMRAIPATTFILWGSLIGGIVGGIMGLGGGSIPGALIGGSVVSVVLLLIFGVLMLFWMFSFYFGCLKCYVTIIFKIIIAPLELAMGAFPNSKMGFSTWIWDLLSNLAVFPISMIFLILGNMIIDASVLGLWAPHIISDLSLQSFVIVGGALGNVVAVGIGLAVVALVAKLPTLVPQVIFAIKPNAFGQAIGEGLQAPKWVGAAGWQAGDQAFKYVATGEGNKKVANVLNKIPGVNVSSKDVGDVAGVARNIYQGVGANVGGQKFS